MAAFQQALSRLRPLELLLQFAHVHSFSAESSLLGLAAELVNPVTMRRLCQIFLIVCGHLFGWSIRTILLLSSTACRMSGTRVLNHPSIVSRILNWSSFHQLITKALLVPVSITLLGTGVYATEYTPYTCNSVDPFGTLRVCFAPPHPYYYFGITTIVAGLVLAVIAFYSALDRRKQ